MIEVVLVMGMAMTILLAGVQLIHMMMQAERAGAASLVAGQTLSRLARTFRADVHAAVAGVPGDAGRHESLELELAENKTVVYRVAENRVDRTAHDAGGTAVHETFVLPESTTRFETAEGGEVVTLVLRRLATTSAKPASNVSQREFRITAVTGRDARFVGANN